jgi:hypothetical protein
MIPTLATDQNRTLSKDKYISARDINHRETPTAFFCSLRRSHRRAMKCIGKFVLSIIVRWRGKEDRTRLQVRLFRSSLPLSLARSVIRQIRPNYVGGGSRRGSSFIYFLFSFAPVTPIRQQVTNKQIKFSRT